MKQLPQSRTLRESVPQQNGQHKKTKSQLPQSSTQRRRERTGRILRNNPNQQDKNDNNGINLKINGKYQSFTIDTRRNHAKQSETIQIPEESMGQQRIQRRNHKKTNTYYTKSITALHHYWV